MPRDMIKKSAYNKQWHKDNKDHRKNKRLQKDYGITLKQYNEFVEFCENRCAICDREERAIHHQTGKVKPLSVDHDHKLGHIRGLLCTRCNAAIGLLEDNIVFIKSAYEYLSLYKELIKEKHATNKISFEEGVQTQLGGGIGIG